VTKLYRPDAERADMTRWTLVLLAFVAALGFAGTWYEGTLQIESATAEPVRVPQEARSAAMVDDPLYAQQWGFAATRAAQAWRVTTGSANVIVAVVDTGVDSLHPDLSGKVLAGWNVIDGTTDTRDENGHGTAVAGIIAARTANRTGVASYCWRCRILPVKVAGKNGTATDADVAAGIVWAATHGARIVNVSLGTPDDSPLLRRAVAEATGAGALVIAAAGNAGNVDPVYPAADPGALAVAGTGPEGALYPWSSSGAWIQVAAPAANVTTASGGSYERFVGTSSATAVVAGIGGLAASMAPSATPAELASALEAGSTPIAGVEFGVVDADTVVERLAGTRTSQIATGAGRHTARSALR